MHQLKIPGKTYTKDGRSIQLPLEENLVISNALKVLGFGATCKDAVGSILIENPQRCRTKTHRKRRQETVSEVIQTAKTKVCGPPTLLTMDRIRPAKSILAPATRQVGSFEEVFSIVSRLSAPRKPFEKPSVIEDDSPRVGFRITIMRRNPEQQQLYMCKLSVPRTPTIAEPIEYNVSESRGLTRVELFEHVERLSKPRSLESLIVRYALPVEDESWAAENSIPQDTSLPIIGPVANFDSRPYHHTSLNTLSPSKTQKRHPLDADVEFLCRNILNIVKKGEEEFPGLVDTYCSEMLQVMVLPLLETRPLRREIHNLEAVIDMKDSHQITKLLGLVNLFPPNRLLLCRLRTLIDSLIKHILSLHSRAQ